MIVKIARNLLIIVKIIFIAFLFISCNSEKSRSFSDKEEASDLITEELFLPEEPLDMEEEEVESIPFAADELFDDFLYHYVSDPKFQIRRTVFPFPYYASDSVIYIEKDNWKHASLYLNIEYYTILFDNEEDMDLVERTDLTSVQFEWIQMKELISTKYYFERKEGMWILEAVSDFDLKGGGNEDFITFFYQFSNDSIFQQQRVNHPLLFVTTDPEDDFSILETTIDREQWSAFKPVLPKEELTNMNYGQRNSENSRNKIVFLKGVNNGFSNTLYFRLSNGIWKLYKFEDISN